MNACVRAGVVVVVTFNSCNCLFPVFADKISEGEFIQGVMDNKEILRLIQYDEPQKIKDKLKEKKQ